MKLKISSLLKEKVIDLSGRRKMDASELIILAKVLKRSKVIITLKLSGNQLTLADEKFTNALAHNNTLESLWLRNNNISDKGAKNIADALRTNQKLKSLLLTGNKIGQVGAESLASALVDNDTLQSISLGGNSFGDRGIESIASVLGSGKCSIKTIYLNDSQIDDKGAEKLSAAIKDNTSLARLELGGNQIGFVGAESLEIALKENDTLNVIGLDNNRIGDEGAESFAAVLMASKTLQRLDLSQNNIGKDGAESLAESLGVNASLIELKLNGNKLETDSDLMFSDVFETNNTIQKVMLGKGRTLHNKSKKKAEPSQVNQSLPQTSLELSLQGRTKLQDDKIKALEAELDSKKPKVIDLTQKEPLLDTQNNNEGQDGPPSKRPRTGDAAMSVEALLHKEIQVKNELKAEAADAKKKAATAERELEAATECPICMMEAEDWYRLGPCGHLICSECRATYADHTCPRCQQPVSEHLKVFK